MDAISDVEPELLTHLDAFILPVLHEIAAAKSRRLAAVYVRGLLSSAERKNVERLARQARGVASAPAFERDLREMLSCDDWRHRSVMWAGASRMMESIPGWVAYTLDDTALLKQGSHSVGVANQYAGCVGSLANCQVLVTLGVAQEHVSAPLAMQLFLPKEWSDDAERRLDCHVPQEVEYRPKWQLALDLLRAAEIEGLPRWPVLADSLYGDTMEVRQWLQERDWPFMVHVDFDLGVWPEGVTFIPRTTPEGRGGRTVKLVPSTPCRPTTLKHFAAALPAQAWRTVCWREGSRGLQRGRFAAVRARPSRRWKDGGVHEHLLQKECWVLLHWPEDHKAPTKAWLSNLPLDATLEQLVALARLRWRVERDYREGKGLAGLDHYEGRTWHGLHHHLALVTLAQQFLALQRWRALQSLSATTPAGMPSPPSTVTAFSP